MARKRRIDVKIAGGRRCLDSHVRRRGKERSAREALGRHQAGEIRFPSAALSGIDGRCKRCEARREVEEHWKA